MTQDDFSKQMEKAFKDALTQADVITANAETIRKQAEVELAAAKEARRKAARRLCFSKNPLSLQI